MMRTALLIASLVLSCGAPAADLYHGNSFAALAGDRIAANPGDSLAMLVFENSSASNSARNQSSRNARVEGTLHGGNRLDTSGGGSLSSAFRSQGATERSGRLVAQLSVTVDAVAPNGDLLVSGAQNLRINGERTEIRLRGRVRRADIGPDNSVRSTRLANAEIAYSGSGYVSKSARPGLASRIFNFLGL